MTIIVRGDVTARPESFERLLEAALAHVARSRTEAGCIEHGVAVDAENPLRLVFFAFIEPFGYRQITVWFRLKAFVRYLQGDHSWGRMKREGFGAAPAPATGMRPAA